MLSSDWLTVLSIYIVQQKNLFNYLVKSLKEQELTEDNIRLFFGSGVKKIKFLSKFEALVTFKATKPR